MKRLYYGDNLQVLKDNIPDKSIDLIYLDPPFNSKEREIQQIAIKPGTRTPPPTPSPQAMRGLRCTLYDWKSL
jgi:DNA modification methylase